jgi:hypothetical protein
MESPWGLVMKNVSASLANRHAKTIKNAFSSGQPKNRLRVDLDRNYFSNRSLNTFPSVVEAQRNIEGFVVETLLQAVESNFRELDSSINRTTSVVFVNFVQSRMARVQVQRCFAMEKKMKEEWERRLKMLFYACFAEMTLNGERSKFPACHNLFVSEYAEELESFMKWYQDECFKACRKWLVENLQSAVFPSSIRRGAREAQRSFYATCQAFKNKVNVLLEVEIDIQRFELVLACNSVVNGCGLEIPPKWRPGTVYKLQADLDSMSREHELHLIVCQSTVPSRMDK